MLSALFVGATGLKTHGEGVNTIANNLSNVSTVGYKQQSIVFEDLISQNLTLGSAWGQVFNQRGLGTQVGNVRTIFTQGGFEPGSSVTDMAISGKGFFQVSNGTDSFYTRAGDFRFTKDGMLNDPNGLTLTGIPLHNGVESGSLEPVHIDFNDASVASNPAKSSSLLTVNFNTGTWQDKTSDASNPYFSLLQAWNGAAISNGQAYNPAMERFAQPLSEDSYSASVPLRVYDASGAAHTLTLYLDGAPSSGGGTTYEFLVAADPADIVGAGGVPTTGTGLLMAGTLSFSSSGRLADLSAYTPAGGDPSLLSSWTQASLADGLPQFAVQFAGQAPQTIKLDLGISSSSGSWSGSGTAADVGTNLAALSSLAGPNVSANAVTAFGGSSSVKSYSQDGYSEGYLSNLEVTTDGYVRASYSNGQNVDLYSIPLFRFTSEDGLRHEGNNLYSAGDEVGEVEFGRPGTSNYGTILSNQLEISNVEMAQEMVNLIVMQRGFQMNSKTITTADTMLQKALELKR